MSDADLIERLREIATKYEIIALKSAPDKSLADHMREAAAKLERLRASHQRLVEGATALRADMVPVMEEALTALHYHIGGNLSPASAKSAVKALRRALRALTGEQEMKYLLIVLLSGGVQTSTPSQSYPEFDDLPACQSAETKARAAVAKVSPTVREILIECVPKAMGWVPMPHQKFVDLRCGPNPPVEPARPGEFYLQQPQGRVPILWGSTGVGWQQLVSPN